VYVFAQSGTCTAQASFEVTVAPAPIPVFDPIADICAGSVAPMLRMSANGVFGSWSPTIDSSIIGTTTYIFTPDASVCAIPATLEVTVVACFGFTLNSYLDVNGNNVEDNGEPKFPSGHFEYVINNDGVVHYVTPSNGLFRIYHNSPTELFEITYIIDAPASTYYNISIPSYSNVSAEASFPNYDFPVTVLQSFTDLNVALIAISPPRTGSFYHDRIVYTNNGNVAIASGSISFSNDAAVTINSVSELGIVPVTNGFMYAFTNLGAFETRSIEVIMQVPPIPTVSLNQLVTNSVSATAGANSDSSILTQSVIVSWDPNDKTESRGGKILFSTFMPEDFFIIRSVLRIRETLQHLACALQIY